MDKDHKIKTAVKYLWNWKVYDGDNFHHLLFDLIAKADRQNYEQLRIGFPDEVQAYETWWNAEDETEFFKQWGLTA